MAEWILYRCEAAKIFVRRWQPWPSGKTPKSDNPWLGDRREFLAAAGASLLPEDAGRLVADTKAVKTPVGN